MIMLSINKIIPIRIRFLVLGKGLALDARLDYDDYLQDDVEKLRTTLICSLLDLANYPASKTLFEKLQLSEYASDLEQESILELLAGAYRTKHPRWDLELLSYMFSVRNRRILQDRKQILKDATDILFKLSNHPDLTKSVVSAAYNIAMLETEEGGRLPMEVIEDTIEIPKNLDSASKYDIYTYSIGVVYHDLKMYDKSADTYLKAIEINPQGVSAWNNRGMCLLDSGNYDEAIKFFDT